MSADRTAPRLARRPVLVGLAALALAACSGDNAPLPGQRLPVRPDDTPRSLAGSRPISLPPARFNADWTHRNGSAAGRIGHPALAPVPQLRWSAPLGEGEGKRSRILAGPVVGGGLVFAVDAGGRLSAIAPGSGAIVWTTSIVPQGQVPDSGPGGGLALANGTLYVASGFGEVLAIDPTSGGIRWRQGYAAPIRSAPTVQGDRIYVVLRNDTALALDARNGAIAWQVTAAGGTGLLGGASPAADGALVILPFASGEVIGVLAGSGVTLWGSAVTGGRREYARNRINDISGDPVIDGSAVYASNQSGRSIRLDRDTGERKWTIDEGSYGPAWPVGGSVFLMSDIGTLVRADAASGTIIWSTQLPEFYPNPGWFGRPRPPVAAVTHYGPILAGGRLWVASGDGALRAFSPTDGSLLLQLGLPGGAAAAPAVAGGILYVTSRDGKLLAFQ